MRDTLGKIFRADAEKANISGSFPATEGRIPVFSQNPQELGLRRQRDVFDVVEEQGPTLSPFYPAGNPRLGAGEGTRAKSEDLTFEKGAGNGTDVHFDQRPLGSSADGVQTTSQGRSTAPGFSKNENRGCTLCRASGTVDKGRQRRRMPKQLGEGIGDRRRQLVNSAVTSGASAQSFSNA